VSCPVPDENWSFLGYDGYGFYLIIYSEDYSI